MRALPGTPVPLLLGTTVLTCVRVEYRGQVLYHHAERQLLLFEAASGGYRRVASAQQLAALVVRRPSEPARGTNRGVSAPGDNGWEPLVLPQGPSPAEEAAQQAAFQAALDRAFGVAPPAPVPPAGSEQCPA